MRGLIIRLQMSYRCWLLHPINCTIYNILCQNQRQLVQHLIIIIASPNYNMSHPSTRIFPVCLVHSLLTWSLSPWHFSSRFLMQLYVRESIYSPWIKKRDELRSVYHLFVTNRHFNTQRAVIGFMITENLFFLLRRIC